MPTRQRANGNRDLCVVLNFLAFVLATFVLAASGIAGQGSPQAPGDLDHKPVAKNPLDEPLSWLKDCRRVYGDIKDYTCILAKKENIAGYLGENHVLKLSFRAQPFSVYMRWLQPKSCAGMEVAFVQGQNNNRLRVHPCGLGRLTGWSSIDVDDKRVYENSRHNIYEAGIGNLMDQTIKYWEVERKLNRTQVKTTEANFDMRHCLRIETTHPDRRQEFYSYRSVLYLDKENKVPVRSECYDWPRADGPADGELLEMYSFLDLRLNVGLTDKDFKK